MAYAGKTGQSRPLRPVPKTVPAKESRPFGALATGITIGVLVGAADGVIETVADPSTQGIHGWVVDAYDRHCATGFQIDNVIHLRHDRSLCLLLQSHRTC